MQNERGQPPEPYDAPEREVPEENPVDTAVERRVPQRTLRRRMLKTEFVYRYAWRTRQHAAEAISTWIGVRYNSRRGHSALDWLSPIEFESAIAGGQSVAA